MILNARIKNSVKELSQWVSENPVLLEGEFALTSDITNLKFGDGQTAYNDLPFLVGDDLLKAGDNISELINDEGYITQVGNIIEIPLRSYNDLQDLPTLFDGDYNSLSNVPTNLSDFTNDEGFITEIGNITEIANRSYNDLQDLPVLFDGEILNRYLFSVQASVVSSNLNYSLDDPATPRSKIHIIDGRTGDQLFTHDPIEIPEFKNANEILVIDNDIFIGYYWSWAQASETYRVAWLRNVRVNENESKLEYDEVEYKDTGVRLIHGMNADDEHIWLSSRQSRTLIQVPIKGDLSTMKLWNNTSIPTTAGLEEIIPHGEYVYSVYRRVVSGQWRGTVFRIKKSDPEATAEIVLSFESLNRQSAIGFIYIHNNYLYAPLHNFALESENELYRVNLFDLNDVENISISLPAAADLHAGVYINGSLWITTGRNPYLVKIDVLTFTVTEIVTLTEAQVPDPVVNGFYGSPETGYITDDIAALGDYLYLGAEVAVQGIVVVNIHDTSDRKLISDEWVYDNYGVTSVQTTFGNRERTPVIENIISEINNADEEPTENSEKLLRSGGTFEAIKELDDKKENAGLGIVNLGNIDGATVIDLNEGRTFVATLTDDITLSFTNIPTTGAGIVLNFTGEEEITWPAGTEFAEGADDDAIGRYKYIITVYSNGDIDVDGLINNYE